MPQGRVDQLETRENKCAASVKRIDCVIGQRQKHITQKRATRVHSWGFLGPRGTNQNLLPYMDPRNHKRDARNC